MSEGGIKNDSEKVRLDLLSPIWLLGVGSVLTFGARKYAAHNWRKGLERSRLLGAALRHILAYLGGEDYDLETGLLHLYHASCCLMFASELHSTHPHLDDRYKAGCRHLKILKPADKSTTEVSWYCADCGAPYLSFKKDKV
jgi:dATP/dGTP diphosphohydrolase